MPQSKKILFLTSHLRYPPDSGNTHDISSRLDYLRSLNTEVRVVWLPETLPQTPPVLAADYTLVHRPVRWARRENPDVVRPVRRIVELFRPDIIWAEYAHFSTLVQALKLKREKILFRSHNFELLHFWQKAWTKGDVSRRFKAVVRESLLIYHNERRMFRIADGVFNISVQDMRGMRRVYGGARGMHCWLPPLMRADEIPVKHKPVLDVVYMGSNYHNTVNLEGAETLVRKVIPAVDRECPGQFAFHFVGAGARAQLGKPPAENIYFHDFIQDLPAFLKSMDISVVSNRLGRGFKVKLAHSLLAGLPVVCARNAARAMPQDAGVALVCDTTSDYARAFVKLAGYDVRRHYARAGRLAMLRYQERAKADLADAIFSAGNSP
jgi:hypothetical protein